MRAGVGVCSGQALRASDITVQFGGLTALNDVSVDVPDASIVGLIGPNGAGKSTLLGVFSGDVTAAKGKVHLGHADVSRLPSQARVRRGLARTFQQPELFVDLTVREHLQLAKRMSRHPSRAWSDPLMGRFIHAGGDDVESLLVSLELVDVADVPVGVLPLGESRLVEIGRAMATDPRVVLLDEPFSGLSPLESGALLKTLARIVETNTVAMVLVEHDVDVVFEMCRKVYVLDFGVLIAQGTPAQIQHDPRVRSAYLGASEPHVRSPAPRRAVANPDAEGEPLLDVERLCVRYGNAVALDEVTLTVRAGSVTVLLGANGAGKSTLAAAVARLLPLSSGRLTFDGTDITRMSAHRVRRLGLAYLPEGRGVFRTLTVNENLRVAVQTLPKRQRADAIDQAVEWFPILGERRSQIAGTLSGGQQQMLSFARVLAHSPRLIVADEASLGLAPLVVDEVFDGLTRAIEFGVAVILIEQFVHRALGLADDCHILRRGRIAWSGTAAGASAEVVANYLGGPGEVSE